MNKLIGISTQSLYYWVPQKQWITEQLQIVNILQKYVSRIELYLTVNDILVFNENHFNLYLKETEGLICSLHLPSLSLEIDQLETLFKKIQKIIEKLHIAYAVWHSDDFMSIEMVVGKVFPMFKFGLENSDPRKFGLQHLKDIALLGSHPIILDIDHVDEFKKDSLNDEMTELKNNVLAIHFSTPSSNYFSQFTNIKTTHFPFAKSGNIPPKVLPKDVPVVIEGVFPALDYMLIEEEISLIQNRYFK